MRSTISLILLSAFLTAYICFSPVNCFSGMFDIKFDSENMIPEKADYNLDKINKSLKISEIAGCKFREKVKKEFNTAFQNALQSALESSDIFSKIVSGEDEHADYELEVNILHQFSGVLCSSRHFINYKITELPDKNTVWEDRMYSLYNHRPCEGFAAFSESVEGSINENIKKLLNSLSDYTLSK